MKTFYVVFPSGKEARYENEELPKVGTVVGKYIVESTFVEDGKTYFIFELLPGRAS